MSVKEDLIAMRQLLADPARWIKGTSARIDNRPILFSGNNFDIDAYLREIRQPDVSFCLNGAAACVSGELKGSRRQALIEAMSKYLPQMTEEQLYNLFDGHPPPDRLAFWTVARWNDRYDRTHEEVLALLDRCIADCDSGTILETEEIVVERELELV